MVTDTTDLNYKEVMVLGLLASGYRRKSIAQAINYSEDSVKAYLKQINAKIGARNATHAVAIAIRRGIIK